MQPNSILVSQISRNSGIVPEIPEFRKSQPTPQNGPDGRHQHHAGARIHFRSRVRPRESAAESSACPAELSSPLSELFPKSRDPGGGFRNSGIPENGRIFRDGWLFLFWPDRFSGNFCMLRVQCRSRAVSNGARLIRV